MYIFNSWYLRLTKFNGSQKFILTNWDKESVLISLGTAHVIRMFAGATAYRFLDDLL
jgi:hypothetical protein